MREHMGLYRGKRIDNGEWVEGYLTQHTFVGCEETQLGYVIEPAPKKLWAVESFKVDPNTIGECTSLKDKNGKLIFEGDVVREYYNGKCVVEYGRHKIGCCGCCYDYHESVGFYLKDKWDSPHSDDEAWHGLEIIGNVHDNPELLKGGEGNG